MYLLVKVQKEREICRLCNLNIQSTQKIAIQCKTLPLHTSHDGQQVDSITMAPKAKTIINSIMIKR